MSTGWLHMDEAQGLQIEAARSQRGVNALFLALAGLLTIFAFIVPVEDHWMSSTFDDYVEAQRLEAGSREGTGARKFAFGSLGLLGIASLLLPGGKQLRLRRIVPIICIAYLAWCATSSLWADEPSTTVRRLGVFFCAIAIALGIAKRATPRQFVGFVVVCTGAWLTLGILAEISLATIRPWHHGYRFAGIFHPNSMAVNAAVLTLASLYLAIGASRKNRGLFLAVAALAAVFLVLTRSRTALGGAVVAIGALWFVIAPIPRIFHRTLVSGMAIACVLMALGLGLINFSTNMAAMGRDDHDMSTLTGRLPLWSELWVVAKERLWTGYGYGSFWTGNRIEDYSDRYYAPISIAHSAYIDLVLDGGLIGAALCLSAMGLAFVRARSLEIQQPKAGYGFIAMLVAYGLALGFLESSLNVVWFLSFFGICGLSFLVFDEPEVSLIAHPQITSPQLTTALRRPTRMSMG